MKFIYEYIEDHTNYFTGRFGYVSPVGIVSFAGANSGISSLGLSCLWYVPTQHTNVV